MKGDGIPAGRNIPISKLPGNAPKLDRRREAVEAMQGAVDELHKIAIGLPWSPKLDAVGEGPETREQRADELHALITDCLDDFAKWRV